MAPKGQTAASSSPLAKGLLALSAMRGKDVEPVTIDTSLLSKSKAVIPTGSVNLDYAIGGAPNGAGIAPCPGYPSSCLIQIWGEESTGKTTLALHACANVHASNGTVCYIDWEHVLDLKYAESLGVQVKDTSKFLLFQPSTLEEGILISAEMIKAGVHLVVYDSVGAGTPEKVFSSFIDDASETDQQTMLLAKIWSQKLPILTTLAEGSGTTLIALSQVRESVKMGFGKSFQPPPPKPQGGNAFKFYASLRMDLKKLENLKVKRYDALVCDKIEKVVGSKVRMTIRKNKWAPTAHNIVDFYVVFGRGVDNVRSFLDIAMAHDIIAKKGNTFVWEDAPEGPFKAVGQDKFILKLQESVALQTALWTQIRGKLVIAIDKDGVVSDDEDSDSFLSSALDD